MLVLDKISKTFCANTPQEKVLFSDFSLTVNEGQFVSVIGSNGSGKTSMLNVICGSILQDSGHIYIGDKEITKEKEHVRAKTIGRVFQDPAMGTCPSMSILENLSLAYVKGQPANLRFGIQKKQIASFKDMLKPLGLGLEDRLHVKVGTLSGGQRQALALLMCTMTPISFLILDEHTAALDPKTAQTIMELTDKIVKEKSLTALMVTHNLRYAVEYGNRILMMHQGEAVLDKAGKEKENLQVEDLLALFNQISIECGN